MTMAKRDYIGEIKSRRARQVRGVDRFSLFRRRWNSLFDAFELISNHRSGELAARRELVRYLPVGAVANLEAYTRLALQALIGRGPPFSDNAKSCQEIRVDISVVLAMGPSRVSAAELVAHLLPISSFEDIVRHASTITGSDFAHDIKSTPSGPLKKRIGDLYQFLQEDIQELFATRHIVCHEMGKKVRLSLERANLILTASLIFADAFEAVVRNHLGQKPYRW
jgi:hypothetical protein